MGIREEIQNSMNDIKTDGYPTAVGELANNYRDGDITIFPEYQRYFRWDIKQKSDLIESLILGIPIPPIFVSQDPEAKWDIIDGLQRVCTVLEFMGVLKKRDNEDFYEPSTLIGTKFLPSLEGKKWDDKTDSENSLDEDTRRLIKRRKLNISIIDSTSNNEVKYELFQRLNTTGSELTQQEIRNCLMVMIDSIFYQKLINISEYSDFSEIIDLSEKQKSEQYDKELITRLIVTQKVNLINVSSQEDMGPFLTDRIVKVLESIRNDVQMKKNLSTFVNDEPFDIEEFEAAFKKTSNLLKLVFGKKAFKKYDSQKELYTGPFSLSIFEVVFKHVMDHVDYYEKHHDELKNKVQCIPTNDAYLSAKRPGTRAIDRMKRMNNLGENIFKSYEN